MSQDLSKLSNEELVALYRSLGGVLNASKFRTKAAGIAKIQELQAPLLTGSAPTVEVVDVPMTCTNTVQVPEGYTVLTPEQSDAAVQEVVATLATPVQTLSKRALRASLSREARKAYKRQVRRTRKAEGRRSKSA